MTYEQALKYISSLESRGWKLGMERTAEFMKRLGLVPFLRGEERPKYIHIAGTNGKGSTTAYVQHAAHAAGLRTGAFFSPFVVDPRERVQFGLELIPKEEFARITTLLKTTVDEMDTTDFGGVTEFELKTAIGFWYWQEQQCELVSLEVGLGGRLDSTNVVDPACAIIVSIGMDHMHILGDTLELIAREKAGIIKPGRPLVLGETPPEARAAILEVARENNAEVWEFGHEIRLEGETLVTPAGTYGPVRPGLFGAKQPHNAALAISALQLAGVATTDAVLNGIATAFAPGRFQTATIQGKTVVFDGAHNVDSALVLRQSLDARFGDRKYAIVTSMLRGHEAQPFYESFIGPFTRAEVAPLDNPRARATEEIAAEIDNLGISATPHDSLERAMASALDGPEDLVVVTGSFYLVGDAINQFVA